MFSEKLESVRPIFDTVVRAPYVPHSPNLRRYPFVGPSNVRRYPFVRPSRGGRDG